MFGNVRSNKLWQKTVLAISCIILLPTVQASVGVIDYDPDAFNPEAIDSMCLDGIDHEMDGDADLLDQGCIRPLWEEPNIEGNTHSTQMTALVNGLNENAMPAATTNEIDEEDTSLLFPNTITIKGNDYESEYNGSEIIEGEEGITYQGDVQVNITHLDKEREEGLRAWGDEERGEVEGYGMGILNETKYEFQIGSDYPESTYITTENYKGQENVRLITAPHAVGNPETDSENLYQAARRGNGIKDNEIENEDEHKVSNYELGHEPESDDHHEKRIEWTEDYGRILEKHGLDEDYRDQPYGSDGLDCDNDEASCEASSCTTCPADCDDADCSVDQDNSADLDNEFYDLSGDWMWREGCQVTGADEVAEADSCDDDCCDGHDCGKYNDECCDSDCDADGDEAGDERGWNEENSQNCDEEYSAVDGGGYETVGNDPAATYTKFTAHADNNWGQRDMTDTGTGSVWCGWDKTLTVNADGPNGESNGWVVIDQSEDPGNDRIVAREGLDGNYKVGYIHHREINHGESLNDDWDTTDMVTHPFGGNPGCPGETEVCLAYLDFWVEEGSGDQGSPEWREYEDAVESEIKYRFTPDEGYSVCKNINRIYQEDDYNNFDSSHELLVCDYKENSGSNNNNIKDDAAMNVAPLPEPCGTKSNEYVYWMEGPQVNNDKVSDYHLHQQRCIDLDDGDIETEMDERSVGLEDSCLNKGDLYREGTVKRVTRHQPDFCPEVQGDEDYPDEFKWACDNEGGTDFPEHTGGAPYDNSATPNDLDSEIGPPVYEADGDNSAQESASWEVCLNIEEDKGSNAGMFGSNPNDHESVGGQWYSLDNPKVSEYLRGEPGVGVGNGDLLVGDSGSLDRFNRHHIAYYYRMNHNPQHSQFNPQGGNTGTALDINCGNPQHDLLGGANCQDGEDDSIHYNFQREGAGHTDWDQVN